jgi:hypothetical protein
VQALRLYFLLLPEIHRFMWLVTVVARHLPCLLRAAIESPQLAQVAEVVRLHLTTHKIQEHRQLAVAQGQW